MTSGADPSAREIADISEIAPSYTQMKALAAGDPRLLRQAELADTVSRLTNLRAIDRQSVNAARTSVPMLVRDASSARSAAERVATALGRLVPPEAAELAALDGLLPWVRALMVSDTRRSYDPICSTRYRCGSLQLEVSVDAADPRAVKLTLLHGFHRLVSEELTIKKLGSDPAKAAATARKTLAAMIADLPARRARLLAEADQCDDRAAAAAQLVASYRFARQDELDAALDELERINRALEYTAQEAATA